MVFISRVKRVNNSLLLWNVILAVLCKTKCKANKNNESTVNILRLYILLLLKQHTVYLFMDKYELEEFKVLAYYSWLMERKHEFDINLLKHCVL